MANMIEPFGKPILISFLFSYMIQVLLPEFSDAGNLILLSGFSDLFFPKICSFSVYLKLRVGLSSLGKIENFPPVVLERSSSEPYSKGSFRPTQRTDTWEHMKI